MTTPPCGRIETDSRSFRFAPDGVTGVSLLSPGLTWEFVRRLKDSTKMRLVLKGIETREDAELCVRHGVEGIIV
jgi:isopentenyl diphosphate isomerase/L-lactate dehydrogenase-like FMN-dependent dehydrogenase